MKPRKYVCCFCKRTLIGFGNNPYPANKREGARCCDVCNAKVVIPARFEVMLGGIGIHGSKSRETV